MASMTRREPPIWLNTKSTPLISSLLLGVRDWCLWGLRSQGPSPWPWLRVISQQGYLCPGAHSQQHVLSGFWSLCSGEVPPSTTYCKPCLDLPSRENCALGWIDTLCCGQLQGRKPDNVFPRGLVSRDLLEMSHGLIMCWNKLKTTFLTGCFSLKGSYQPGRANPTPISGWKSW